MFHLRAQTRALLLGVVAALLVAESHCLPAQIPAKQVISQDELVLSMVVNQIAVLRLLNESSTIYSLHERELDEKTEELKSEMKNILETAFQQFQNMAMATLNEINARNEETRQMLNDVKVTALNVSRQDLAGLGDSLAAGNLPYAIPDELSRILFGGIPTTTTKPSLRVTSAEDFNRVFNGNENETEDGGEDYDEEHEREVRGGPNIKSGRPRVLESQRACTDKPPEPLNGRIDCSPYSGCRAVCDPRHQFPTGERRFFLRCENRVWVLAGSGRGSVMPNCEPICRPPCQNNGICLAPNRCQCPDNWQGATCETPKLPPPECSRKPPTPANSKIFCSRDECHARCHEGYQFAESTTRLIYMCENGDWVIKHESFAGTNPDCEPACDPTCINGGRCIAPDVCECTQEYRGNYCQYPISNCDPKKMGFNGGYNCSGEGMDFGCKLWCPDPVEFEFPAAQFYNCDYATSIWSPSPIPMCNYPCTGKPPEPLNGRTDCSPYSGCRAVCDPRHQFPTGERRFFLRCEFGVWVVVAGGSRSNPMPMPDCEPICRPPCQNNGICLAPNRCQCPDNWQGTTCETPKVPPP